MRHPTVRYHQLRVLLTCQSHLNHEGRLAATGNQVADALDVTDYEFEVVRVESDPVVSRLRFHCDRYDQMIGVGWNWYRLRFCRQNERIPNPLNIRIRCSNGCDALTLRILSSHGKPNVHALRPRNPKCIIPNSSFLNGP